ncbi:hypothetical protein PFUGPA_06005 [Plasmodium falciparum Palo Alto/Uganda]|uniref:Uncharacterized protein n=1 Tax=Plasmodium falciparum (isolate Palo Alto / Uganda) TaxID=57270 RepID=W4IQJ6_PLAFP|nr:hypothetical protein PFUGPA_06005 [Plasmodium falciparum Palo Alto/Uganda]
MKKLNMLLGSSNYWQLKSEKKKKKIFQKLVNHDHKWVQLTQQTTSTQLKTHRTTRKLVCNTTVEVEHKVRKQCNMLKLNAELIYGHCSSKKQQVIVNLNPES